MKVYIKDEEGKIHIFDSSLVIVCQKFEDNKSLKLFGEYMKNSNETSTVMMYAPDDISMEEKINFGNFVKNEPFE